MTNKNHTVLYVGVTSDLILRMVQHRTGFYTGSFTSRYHVTQLVYYEVFESILIAISREKQLKGGSRQKKLDLVNLHNPQWKEISVP